MLNDALTSKFYVALDKILAVFNKKEGKYGTYFHGATEVYEGRVYCEYYFQNILMFVFPRGFTQTDSRKLIEQGISIQILKDLGISLIIRRHEESANYNERLCFSLTEDTSNSLPMNLEDGFVTHLFRNEIITPDKVVTEEIAEPCVQLLEAFAMEAEQL
jgi:hypothetical protein